jgi:hypothetical protein
MEEGKRGGALEVATEAILVLVFLFEVEVGDGHFAAGRVDCKIKAESDLVG